MQPLRWRRPARARTPAVQGGRQEALSNWSVEVLAADVYPALYRDLAERPERVGSFFPLAPEDPAAWRARAAEVRRLWAGEEAGRRRSRLVAALRGYHERIGPLQPVQLRNLEALAQDALVVVTGQQAGLLGGPLYTLYKALGAVLRAEQASGALGCPVVPVFWIASEDHDWSEVGQAQVVAPDGRLVHLRLPGSGDFRSAGQIPVPAEARRLVGELLSLFPPTPAAAAVRERLVAGLRWAAGKSLVDWFAWQLQDLLGGLGLLLYDPMLPDLRALAAPVLAGAVGRAPAVNAAVAESAAALRAVGYSPGLDGAEDHLNLFVYLDGRRVALHLRGGRVRSRDGRVDCTPEELAERVLRDPTGFSPNVALRPIVQDHTLPVLCQLAGPGEVAYLAQLRGAFALWERSLPVVGPRPGATLVLPEDQEALHRASARVEDLLSDPQAVVDRAVAARAPVDLDALFAAERQCLDRRYAALEERLAAVAPALRAITRGNADRVRLQLTYLEKKARQHLRRAQRDLSSAVRAAAQRLFPAGGLQERGTCAYPYLLREGTALIDGLRAAMADAPGPFGRHWLLRAED
jgi:bacillithiol biosynthesis cysteine-adding enzyme BshC